MNSDICWLQKLLSVSDKKNIVAFTYMENWLMVYITSTEGLYGRAIWKLLFYEASVSRYAACVGIIRLCIGVYEYDSVFMSYYSLIM